MMKRFAFILCSAFCTCVLTCCTNVQQTQSEDEGIQSEDSSQALVNTIPLEVIEAAEQPLEVEVESHTVTTSRQTSTGSSSYHSYSNDNSDDYWEEKRKHSPNDNYLLGFDEDVDDVHDMELYMEDY